VSPNIDAYSGTVLPAPAAPGFNGHMGCRPLARPSGLANERKVPVRPKGAFIL
jgi:hypothetical protein